MREHEPLPMMTDWDLLEFHFGLDTLKPFLSDAGKDWLFHLPQDKQRKIAKWWHKNRPATEVEIAEYIVRHRK